MTTAAERKKADKELDEAVKTEEEATAPQPTPVEERPKEGKYKDELVEEVVGEYPERPYVDAMSATHAKFLAEKHPAKLRKIISE